MAGTLIAYRGLIIRGAFLRVRMKLAVFCSVAVLFCLSDDCQCFCGWFCNSEFFNFQNFVQPFFGQLYIKRKHTAFRYRGEYSFNEMQCQCVCVYLFVDGIWHEGILAV